MDSMLWQVMSVGLTSSHCSHAGGYEVWRTRVDLSCWSFTHSLRSPEVGLNVLHAVSYVRALLWPFCPTLRVQRFPYPVVARGSLSREVLHKSELSRSIPFISPDLKDGRF